MSDRAPSRRILDPWLKNDNSAIFSQEIIRHEQSRIQNLPAFMKRAQLFGEKKEIPASSPMSPEAFSSRHRLMLWYASQYLPLEIPADMEITDVTSDKETNDATRTPAEQNDVTTADQNDVILEQLYIPKVWQIIPAQLTSQVSQHQLQFLAHRIKDTIDTAVMQPLHHYNRDTCILSMFVNKLSEAHNTTAYFQPILETEREQAKSSQQALQKKAAELESSLAAFRKQTKSSRNTLQKQIDELKSSLEDVKHAGEQAREALRSHLSKPVQTSGTQTPSEIPEEIFYDALSSVDTPEEIFYDAISEDFFYDALSTLDDELTSSDSAEDIFYDALFPDRKPAQFRFWLTSSLDTAVERGIRKLEFPGKTTPNSRGTTGTIVTSVDDLVPFREPKEAIVLGRGRNGIVLLYRHAITNRPVALKKFGFPHKFIRCCVYERRREGIVKMLNEMEVLKRLGSMEWFPEFYGCCRTGEDVVCVAMEFFGDVEKGQSYSILNCMEGKGPKPDKDSWMSIMLDVVDALTVIHKEGYLYNDLKEDNVILVKSQGEWRAKIIDFGWSRNISIPFTMHFRPFHMYEYKHRQRYSHLAPEVVLKGQPFSVSSDIYSLGRLAAFIAQEVPDLKELGDYGVRVCKVAPRWRPSLQEFRKDIIDMRSRISNQACSSEGKIVDPHRGARRNFAVAKLADSRSPHLLSVPERAVLRWQFLPLETNLEPFLESGWVELQPTLTTDHFDC